MEKTLIKTFIDNINEVKGHEYIYYIIAYNIAPTILNYKPASLINFSNVSRGLNDLWKKYKREIIRNSYLKIYELKNSKDNSLVLFYNTKVLQDSIYNENNMDFLSEYGYRNYMTIDECLYNLSKRFYKTCPHEIGIFLGIPLEDVKGFINNRGSNSLLSGYWKVYNNPENALKIFNSYDMAKNKIIELSLNNANPMDIIKNSFIS